MKYLYLPPVWGCDPSQGFYKKEIRSGSKGTTNDKLFKERRDKKNEFFLFKKKFTLLRLINSFLILKEIYK